MLQTTGPAAKEPFAVVDPNDRNRLAVAAMVEGGDDDHIVRSFHLWQSSDGGVSWRGAQVEFPQFAGEGAADPVLAFAEDGTLLVAGMSLSRQLANAMMSAYYDRSSVPSLEDSIAKLQADVAGVERADVIAVVRLDGENKQLGGTVIRPSVGSDKPAIAVDHSPTSPFYGSAYVAWHDMAEHGMLYVARSVDGGRTFGDPVPVVKGPPWGNFISQLGIRPDGSLHIVWTSMVQVLPTAPPDASTSVWHAVSRDGGRSFAPPKPIARHAGLALTGFSAFGVAATGEMLVVWGQGSEVPRDPLAQVRHRLFSVRSTDGDTWSEPTLVSPETPATTSMGLPAVVEDRSGWRILTYLSDDVATEVVIFRSNDGGRTFVRERTLARREIPLADFFLHGNYILMRCSDVARVGDYAGFAASNSRLIAAFVLPENDDPTSKTRVYVDVQ